MKKVLSILVVCCMVIGIIPVISLAADSTYKAVRTAYFNSTTEWKLYDNSTGNDNILVASNGSDSWQAEGSFTDLDGTVTSQSYLNGTGFATPRNALVAFSIPEGFDPDKTVNVTLSMKIKNVKQVTSGVKLAVYGNSVDGVWSESDDKTTFGAEGNSSGLSDLTCLGLTTPISTGNQTGESASGETVTLSSRALTEYVCQMARDGKSEVTFRVATPLGGIRIYSYNVADAPTLTIEEGETASVEVNHVFYDGDTVIDTETVKLNQVKLESEFVYDDSNIETVEKNGEIYLYNSEKSTLSTVAKEDGSGFVTVAYSKFNMEEHSFKGYEIDDEGAWCWFADPRSISYKNEEGTIDVTIIGYIDVHGNIKATQVNNLTDKVDEVLIRTNLQPDDHNNPTFLILPDERIVVFYSRHTDEACFWYRVTKEKGDLTTLGEEKCLTTSANTTYPSPFLLSDDPDNIYLCWRGIGWHPTIAKISIPDENGDMHFTYGPYQMVQSTGARPYAKYASNGKDKIYMSYTTGHPDNEDPNWLYFNQIDINTMTMQDINGNKMSTIANGPLSVNKSNTSQSNIVDRTSGVRNWLWQVAVAEDGYPVIANVRINGGKTSHDYYYVKWNGTEWVKTFVTNAGGKFHPSNTEYCYSGGMSIDADNPNVMYCSKPVAGVFGNIFEIFKYTMSLDGTKVESVEQITKNSQKNNVRPWVIPNSEGDDLRVLWMNGDYYYWMVKTSYPEGYPTAAMSNVPLPVAKTDIDNYVDKKDYEDIGGAFVSTKSTGNIVSEYAIADEFTVSADIYLGGDYQGEILDMGDIKLSVKNAETRYADDATAQRPRVIVTVDGKDYLTYNVYGISDDWKYNSTGTTGDYYFTKYDRFVNLTVSYDGEYLTIYRDGLIDFKEKINIYGIEKVVVGGFEGYAENVTVFDRAINHDELKLLSDNDYEVKDPGFDGDINVVIHYAEYSGEGILPADCNEFMPSETVILAPGTNVYDFTPQTQVFVGDNMYELVDKVFYEESLEGYGVYKKYNPIGTNLVPDGSFEDEDGNFSWGTWQSPETGNYFKDTCNDWFYKVNHDTLDAALYATEKITADDYALGTRWNDGSLGLCSLANFIKVESGKTYFVAYDYMHTTQGTSGDYISTSFVTDKTMSANASGNNIPKNVKKEWQTNKFAIEAEEDGYIYFHFSYLGSSNNAGNGPYWYFDNFKVFELEQQPFAASIDSVTDLTTKVRIENLTDKDITNLKVYAASYNDDGEILNAMVKTVDITYEELTKTVSFDLGGNVKVFFWDDNMKPLHSTLSKKAENSDVNIHEGPVMVVTKVSSIVSDGQKTTKLTGIVKGSTAYVIVDPKEYGNVDVEIGNVIIYSTNAGYATDIQVLFTSNKDGIGEITGGLGTVVSDKEVTVHYGEITYGGSHYVELGSAEEAQRFYYTNDCNVTVVDYTKADIAISSGTVSSINASTEKYKRSAFVKTDINSEDDITDVVVFIEPKR
ncbi:MAG: BNR repeat-containing protein [Clostridia bacterium]